MSKYYDEVPFTFPEDTPSSSDDEFFGSGWSVKREGGRFYFSYLSGQLQGKSCKIEISESDFEGAKQGGLQFDEMCRKYNIH
jgi:hypothetical protein